MDPITRARLEGYVQAVMNLAEFLMDAGDSGIQKTPSPLPTASAVNPSKGDEPLENVVTDLPAAALVEDDSTNPNSATKVWPAPNPENPYDPTRSLYEAYPYLDGVAGLQVEELTNRFERRDQGAATILILQRMGVKEIGQLIGYSEERILSDEFRGISQLRMDLLKGALQSLDDEVAENSH